METFQNWVAPFMSVSTTKRTEGSTIMPPPFVTIELVLWIFFGICRTTFGRPWGSLHTHTLRPEAMRRTANECYGGCCGTSFISALSLSTIGELEYCSC